MAKALKAFEALLRRVISIPKEQVDKRIAEKREQTIERRAKSTDDPQKK